MRLPLDLSASPGVLTVSPGQATLAWIGARGKLTGQILSGDGRVVQGFSYRWSSLDPSVVTVDNVGVITAVTEGSARVIVSLLNLADTAVIAVKRLPAKIVLSADTVLFTEFGATANIQANVSDGGGQALTSANVTWRSSDTLVAKVSPSGTVTAVGQGRATVTVSAGAVDKRLAVRVAVGPSEIAVDPENIVFEALEQTALLDAEVLDAAGDVLPGVNITYSSSKPQVATVSPTGLVTAKATGATSVTVKGDTVEATVNVTVTQVPATVVVTPDTVTVVPGGSATFAATVTDANGFDVIGAKVGWFSTSPGVAAVTPDGVALGVNEGVALIVGSSGPVADTGQISVVDIPVARVEVTPDVLSMNAGDRETLSVQFFAADGSVLVGPRAVWSSSDASVALVSATGEVTGVGSGIAWVKAAVDAAADSTQVTVALPAGAFNIQIRFVGTAPTPEQQIAFTTAESMWETVIIGELGDQPVNIPADQCGITHPAVDETVDDLVIFAELAVIDGPSGILGQAGPCITRVNGLAAVGVMTFDVADVAGLLASGSFGRIVVHEMGHVLSFGVGSPWNDVLVGSGGADPYWPGTQALSQYGLLGGSAVNAVPVANTGGTGTRDAHWREADMGAELMTGFYNSGVFNPMSAITVGAMQDMGYVVDLSAAESYTVGPLLRGGGGSVIELREAPLPAPTRVDAFGRPLPSGR